MREAAHSAPPCDPFRQIMKKHLHELLPPVLTSLQLFSLIVFIHGLLQRKYFSFRHVLN